MIVRMKRVSIVCRAEDREATLQALRGAGVLHLVPVTAPAGAELDDVRGRVALAHAAQYALGQLPGPAEPGTWGGSAPEAVAQVDRALRERRQLDERLGAMKSEAAALGPWGDFDPAQVRALQARGVTVRLYRVPGKKQPQPPPGATLFVLGRDSSGWQVAVAALGEAAAVKDGIEFPLPPRGASELRRAMASAQSERAALEQTLAAARPALPLIARHLEELAARQRYLEARAGMGMAGRLLYLRGFCPADRVDTLQKLAPRQGWAVLVEEPSETDSVPTLIRNPAWIRPIESLFKLVKILPGYREVDVSWSFLLSLSIFFAMIVGDAGYGALFLVSTLAARVRMRQAPPEPFRLMYMFSACTIVWGVVTGTYFGVTKIPPLLEGLRVGWLTSTENMMLLCLVLGCAHLTLAHLWNVVRWINSLQAIAQAGWIAVVWALFILIRYLLFNAPLPAFFAPLAGGGLLAVVLFMTPPKKLKSEWINHVMLPLTIMSNFGDILSYLRLFALGVASLELASAFNSMVTSFGGPAAVRILAAALVLAVGHGLNVVLSLISVLIHGIRLNALEFSMHLGIEWSGRDYLPFGMEERETENAPAG